MSVDQAVDKDPGDNVPFFFPGPLVTLGLGLAPGCVSWVSSPTIQVVASLGLISPGVGA